MKKAVKIIGLALCAAFLLQTAPKAGALDKETWSLPSPDEKFVTVRVECPEGPDMKLSEQERLLASYGDTGEIIPLSNYYDQAVYATVPASEADRPITWGVVQEGGEGFQFVVEPQSGPAFGGWDYDMRKAGEDLIRRGIFKGNGTPYLSSDDVLTRAELFTIVLRVMEVRGGGEDPGYRDVKPGDWYYETACAAKAYGLAAGGALFEPGRSVTRQEAALMIYRLFHSLGWAEHDSALEDMPVTDLSAVPDWAMDAYKAGFGIFDEHRTDTGRTDPYDGVPVYESSYTAEPSRPATRGEVAMLLSKSIERRPVYPSALAIEYGFDAAMPEIDGSTSTYAYTDAVFGALFDNYTNHPQFPENHSKSYESYERLIGGEADMLFAATEPSEEQKAAAKAAGVELTFVPIAHDAMVFFTNAENAAAGLTKAQIQDIYVGGAVDDWNQVGGPDAELLPFSRNIDSGSHALMEQWFLEDGKLNLSEKVTQVNVSMAMSSALTDVAQALRADPPAYALGYSVYYYYTNGYWLLADAGGRDLKLLAVDGVVPSDETIADGSYPLSGYNYVVFRSDEPENSPARRLAEFMRSPAGQTCVDRAGYGPLTPAE